LLVVIIILLIQSLALHNLLIIPGPEKQILLNKEFIRRANDILSKIENHTVMSSRGGGYTVKELKDIAIRNKIKITKKNG